MSTTILDWKKLLKQHGFTESQVREWAERKYPMFANNISLMAFLFLQEKGISLQPRIVGVYQAKKVSDLVAGDRAEIQVLVGAKLGEVHYFGCPECYTKVEERENRYYCPKCDKYVEANEYVFRRYIAGDETGNVIVVIPPYVEGELNIGKLYKLRGRMQDNGEFSIREFEEVELPTPSVEEEREEVIEVKVPVREKEESEEEEIEEEIELPETIEAEVEEEKEVVEEEKEEKEEEKKEEEEVEILPELADAKISEEEKKLATKVYNFILSKGGVTASDVLKEFGDKSLVLLTVLRQCGLIKLEKTEKKYMFVPVGKERKEKKTKKKEERKESGQAKLFEEPQVSLDEIREKVRKMLMLFGGSINMEDFEKWYKNQPFADKVSLDDILNVDWIEIKDGNVCLKK